MNRIPVKNSIAISGFKMQPKMIIACVLLGIMAVLWIRILLKGKGGPQTAGAQPVANPTQVAVQQQSKPTVRINSVALPMDPDVHERLSRDPFMGFGASWFAAKGEKNSTDPEVTSPQEKLDRMHQANLEAIANRLILEAVIQDAQGKPEKAFVDGKVLSVGSLLAVRQDDQKYELKVEKITNTKATLVWQAFSITVKLTTSEWIE